MIGISSRSAFDYGMGGVFVVPLCKVCYAKMVGTTATYEQSPQHPSVQCLIPITTLGLSNYQVILTTEGRNVKKRPHIFLCTLETFSGSCDSSLFAQSGVL